MNWLGIAIFALTYVLICARRLSWLGLDRPAGAMLGAVLCVVLGVLDPDEALAAVDGRTMVLLFSVMGIGAFLAVDGFFDWMENLALRHAKTPAALLGAVVWAAGILSAFITNDAVCVLGAPLVVRMIRRHRLPPHVFLLALATSANTGSVGTLVGNPQNMLCGSLGGLSYRMHVALVGPMALACLGINHTLLWLMFRRQLRACSLEARATGLTLNVRAYLTLAVMACTVVAYTAGADLAWASAGGLVALMVLHRRDTGQLWPKIDWSVLVFFGGLFVVVKGFANSGGPGAIFSIMPLWPNGTGPLWGWFRTAGLFLVGSNIVSNVPFILVVKDQMAGLPDQMLGWEILAVASTFAGNLTLLGSVANIIVAQAAREVGGIGFWQYLRVGLPLALLTTLAGTFWLVLVWGFF